MRKLTRSILATTAVVGLLALPVAGAVGADNTVTFTVAANSNGLSISNDASSVDLTSGGDVIFDLTSQGVSGTLPATTVTDERGLLNGWTVSVSSSGAWVNQGDDTKTVPAANGRVYMDVANLSTLTSSLSGALTGMTVTGAEFNGGSSNLSSSYTLIQGTTTSLGTAEVTYTPAISVTIPGSTAPGTYSATITQTAT